MKTTKHLLFAFFISLLLFSCSKDSDDNSVSAPTDFEYPTGGPVPFYTHGSTGTPTINWNNDIGTFTLDNNYMGVSIDENTGVLSWNEDLPLHENYINVTATNSAGIAQTTVLFLHQFSGVFNGGHNLDPTSTMIPNNNLNITFNVDGTLNITDHIETVSGTWSFNNAGKLICNYTLTSGNFELEFDLTYSLIINPYLAGIKRMSGSTTAIGFARLDYQ